MQMSEHIGVEHYKKTRLAAGQMPITCCGASEGMQDDNNKTPLRHVMESAVQLEHKVVNHGLTRIKPAWPPSPSK